MFVTSCRPVTPLRAMRTRAPTCSVLKYVLFSARSRRSRPRPMHADAARLSSRDTFGHAYGLERPPGFANSVTNKKPQVENKYTRATLLLWHGVGHGKQGQQQWEMGK